MEFNLNRRSFVKGAAVAGAFLPSFNILHAEERTIGPKDDQINVALIGFGAEARVLSASLVRIPGVRVRAVCDIWKFQCQQAKQFFKNFGMDVTTYEDYREMLSKEDKNIDAVVIATPDWMHCEHTCACLRAGKHVYCEKEMSNKLEQAAEMCRVQKETGKLLQIGHQRRSNPRYRHCFENVVPHMLGRITTAYAQWNRTLAPFFSVKRPPKQEILTKYGYENAERWWTSARTRSTSSSGPGACRRRACAPWAGRTRSTRRAWRTTACTAFTSSRCPTARRTRPSTR